MRGLFAFGEACWSVECARGAERCERSAGSCCLHICHFEQQSQQPRKQTNRHKKRELKRHAFFCECVSSIFIIHIRNREELAYQINWRIDPAADEIDADMRVHYRLSAANIRRADGFCVFYTHFLRLCVRVLRAGRNPILLSSHIWFINMRADKFIAEPECCACAPIHHLVAHPITNK